MHPIAEFEEYKRKEYIGDALYNFVSREVLCVDWQTKHAGIALFNKIQSNYFMAGIAKKMGLEANPLDNFTYPEKPYANALEVFVYNLYEKDGVEAVKKWFTETIVPEIKNRVK